MNYSITTKRELEDFVLSNWQTVNSYLDEFNDLPLSIYSSVDIRESETKFAPVDNNIYPAGFNNICKTDLNICSEQFKYCFEKINNRCSHVGIIPESHTKNLFYLDHLATLSKCIKDAGFKVSIISFDSTLFLDGDRVELISNSSAIVEIFRCHVENGEIRINNSDEPFSLVLLNHDQSIPIDINWQDVSTIVIPSPKMGWYQRNKSKHFACYKEIIDKFCDKFSIDPDLLQAKFESVDEVDFISKSGVQRVADCVDAVLGKLPAGSNVFVKANRGTYGMGITVVSKGSEIVEMNRKSRNKMAVGKNRIEFNSVLVQEGVETILKYGDMPAEVSIYLVGGRPIGGFMRANPLKGTNSNLNAKGMVFRKFCISEISQQADHKAKEAIYSIIARLSTIASAMEILELN